MAVVIFMYIKKENIEPKRKVEVSHNHYVPRSYLSLFENEKGKIKTLNQKNGKVFLAKVSNVGMEKNYIQQKIN